MKEDRKQRFGLLEEGGQLLIRANQGRNSDAEFGSPRTPQRCFSWWAWVYSEMLEEISRREKEAGIRPEADVDVFMKVSQ